MLQKKCVWQVTTIIQPALRHLGTSHFWKVLYNKIPMGQIRWPIFLFFMYMLVLSEKMSIFPKSNMFWILVFSCPKMTLITIFTRMTQDNLDILDITRKKSPSVSSLLKTSNKTKTWYLQKYPILAVSGPSCRLGWILMVQNGWYRGSFTRERLVEMNFFYKIRWSEKSILAR